MTSGTRAVLTLGHSTRTLEAFLGLLAEHGVQRIVDVRTVPRSARHPDFDRAALAGALAAHGIAYAHAPELGGLRRPRPDSINLGWKDEGFRGFADHMQTPVFAARLAELIALAGYLRVAILCAEAVPWRCHRSLIADALVARGLEVEHILGPGARRAHALTRFARVEGERVVYPAAQPHLPGFG